MSDWTDIAPDGSEGARGDRLVHYVVLHVLCSEVVACAPLVLKGRRESLEVFFKLVVLFFVVVETCIISVAALVPVVKL